MNDDGNFRNGGNVRNDTNAGLDIKCHTFWELQPQADLNDDGNVRNGENIREVDHNSGHE